jgi:myo-inositol-1(or 4)-monophosphatase
MGSYRNSKKISPSETPNLSEALIGLDLNTLDFTELSRNLSILLTKCRHIRHLGANALELCYVADGTTDAFIDIRGKLRTTDIAAATLIIQEAGALITTPNNTPLTNNLYPTERVSFIATGNTNLHQAITGMLEKAN